MKNTILTLLLIAAVCLVNAQIPDSVTMNPGYTNQVYYSFTGQTKTSVSFDSWDLGFQTTLMDASIISNDNAVRVFLAPGADSNDYATLDVSGYASWQQLYNSDTSWNLGAFNTGENLAAFNFGWGIYDFNSHNVYGNTLYAVEKGGYVFKFWIRKKTSTGDYLIRYANVTLAGADVNLTLTAAAYATKNFVYLNLDSPGLLDVEPENCCWQILFTHYLANIPYAGYYPVTGVFSAPGVTVAKAYPVDLGIDSFELHMNEFKTSLSAIGYDWKTYDVGAMQYFIEDSLIYYVHTADNYIWSLQFTSFDDVNGKIYFNQELVFDPTLGVENTSNNLNFATVYPNPVAGNATLIFNAKKNANVEVMLFDVTGKEVMQTPIHAVAGLNTQSLSLPSLSNGVYHLVMNQEKQQLNLKLIVAQ